MLGATLARPAMSSDTIRPTAPKSATFFATLIAANFVSLREISEVSSC